MNPMNDRSASRRLSRRLCSLILWFSFAVSSPMTFAADETHAMLNFVNADIESVVRGLGKITGRNFIVDPRVKGVVNIVSTSPVSPALAYDIVLAALRLQGFAAVERNGATIILPEADAKFRGGAVSPRAKQASGEQVVTEVFNLKYESAVLLLPIIRPLVPANNPVTAHPGSNTLVVTDYAENLRRVAQIIESIDQPSAFEPIVISVKHGSATELAAAVSRILADNPSADISQRVSVVAEPRSNTLILRADNPSRITRVRALIERLDSAGEVPGNIHVIYLRNAEASKLALTLRAILSGDTTSASPATAPVASAGSTAGGQAAPTGSGIVQADAGSNALIITAPDAVFNNVRAIVEKLDVRRAQVHIEALIAEVTADRATEFGIQWQGVPYSSPRTVIASGTNFNSGGNNILGASVGAATGAPAMPGSGLNIGVLNRININGKAIVNLSILARALETDSNANILSTPNLLTLDNEEAKIVIGQNVPFVTGQYAQTGTAVTATPFQTIERKDVGLTLKVKPQISEGGTVRLQVFQEVSSVDSTGNTSGIITNKRSLESTVLLQDGQIIVLGGLIQDSITDGAEKVPLLGDIPLLGALFSYEKKKRTKTNLMVFLRPTILRTDSSAERLTSDRYGYIMGLKDPKTERSAELPDFATLNEAGSKTSPAPKPAR
ncbi:MAG: type II secretion system secretin GspD [Sulfuritalea sp.]|jgi:general secretion pathway protein D|nr:type II secretion system secretin GspD [Sulfuritalea sp.]